MTREDTRVADHNIQTFDLSIRPGNNRPGLFGIGNITGNTTTLAAQFLNNRGDPGGIYIVDGHPGAFSDKCLGNCLADAVAGSGYQNFFFLKSQN
jgi:hypothetical protein